ncbi:MAG: hypothetical protein HRT61_22455 [Ekhidna sp.]|nr:hypothetical protein [Ekhidna sp.]
MATAIYLLVPFSCSFGDEPSCSGGGWIQETQVESIGLIVGSMTEDRGFSYDRFTSFEHSVMNIHVEDLKFLAKRKEHQPTKSNFLISSAVASPGPQYVTTQTIATIRIYSDKQVSTSLSKYGPGSDLSELFSIIPANMNEAKKSFIDFIAEQKAGVNVFGDYEHPIYFSLNERVKIENQSITVSITFDDESIVTASTSDFVID